MLLRAIELVVRHHPSLPPVLDRISFDLAAGELVAIVGANGSGKSTLARALAGLVPLESGSVVGARHGAPLVGLVLQDPAAQLVEVTAADEVALGPRHAGLAPAQVATLVDSQLDAHGLRALAGRDPASLSGGQQQRLASAAITACAVDVLVLDEPTALLDEPARRAFAARVREVVGHRAAAWITQEPDEVAACDRVLVLDAGQLVWDGPVDAWLADPSIAATWGLDLPAPARIAHALHQRGVLLHGEGVPRTLDELRDRLLAGAPGG
jgi:energy-coupling factor transporter ATP-binding protein EcfA2